MDDPNFLDYYEMFDLDVEATDKQIGKAFRKLALKLHPDKNPDNPDAIEKFYLAKKASEILLDPAQRREYDAKYKARKQQELRWKEMDAERQALKRDLERKEAEAAKEAAIKAAVGTYASKDIQERLNKLRAEGRARKQNLFEEMKDRGAERWNQVASELARAHRPASTPSSDSRAAAVTVKWKRKNAGPIINTHGPATSEVVDAAVLKRAFHKFGGLISVHNLKDRRATLVFGSMLNARAVLRDPPAMFDVKLVGGLTPGQEKRFTPQEASSTRKDEETQKEAHAPSQPAQTAASTHTSSQAASAKRPVVDEMDEDAVLAKMMAAAAARKRQKMEEQKVETH